MISVFNDGKLRGAAKLVNNANGKLIDDFIKNKDIQGKIGQKLNANIDQLPMSQRLVTINKDVEIELDISDLTLKEADTAKLKSIYKELELNTLYKSIIDEHEETKKIISTIK